ncbi:MAG: pyrroloquinoline quinone biosynthesis protein PqqB [Bacteroidetes bacterium RIFCSPHIGHO2_02_FULL_44_7]|nr:MAG: pyrroloquinoline quinone biosynthesis protein PqqB [Bacteroidetes bacterium RIFCSPHIGHO2_02_FULL_44_7]
MRLHLFLFISIALSACELIPDPEASAHDFAPVEPSFSVELIVLGTLQDAGSPHAGCRKNCCADLFKNPDPMRAVVSLGILDRAVSKRYIFEASPDLSRQMYALATKAGYGATDVPDAFFLTHAHIGHYAGLMYLGREALNADSARVYCPPRMFDFLKNNGPWSQLVALGNISLRPIEAGSSIDLGNVQVQALLVPHRDEFSETVGYIISGPKKKALFIPDIDKWEKWDASIVELLHTVDYAFLDATFYDAEEINHRAISEIPHPFVAESMELFKKLSAQEKAKIHFIHFNHTNPLLNPQSAQSKEVIKQGFRIARMGQVFEM